MDTVDSPPARPPAGAAAPPVPGPREHWKTGGICAVLTLLVWTVFGQTLGFAFTNYDDGEYVYENPHVTNGLSWDGVRWAFQHAYASNWHPLTWISHMADAQLYGRFAGGHHGTNVLLHTAAALLLFFAWRELTGAAWRSAFVAAVFAIHPLRAESVAWVAERKDVLSGVFFMLTFGAYARYARAARPARWYLAALAAGALGLLAKPSLVTLPFVLALLDYWPLRRFAPGAARQLILEKLPFLALSAASCVVTVFAQAHAIVPIAGLPFGARCANAAWAYAVYLGQMADPADLAVLYPLRLTPWTLAAPAFALLAAVSAAAFLVRRGSPWMLVGWLWYLGMLVPMIGLMQVGSQAHADRYTYLPQIGLSVALAWTLAAWAGARPARRRILAAAAGVWLAALVLLAHWQVAYWRNSETLWRHTLAVTARNALAHNLLAVALSAQGRGDEAFAEFGKSLRINPRDAGTHFYLGLYLARHGKLDDAIRHLRRSIQLSPRNPGAEANLGLALASQGRATEAVLHYRRALEIEPDFLEAQNDLAWTLATHPDPAKRGGEEAVALARRLCQASNYQVAIYLDTLAAALAETGDFAGATRQAQAALERTGADAGLRKDLEERLAAYQRGQPWREAAPDPPL